MTGEVAAGLNVTVDVKILSDTDGSDTAAGITPQGLVGFAPFEADSYMRIYDVNGSSFKKIQVLNSANRWANANGLGSANGNFYIVGTPLYNCTLIYNEVNPYTDEVTSTAIDSIPNPTPHCGSFGIFPSTILIPGVNPTVRPRLVYAKERDDSSTIYDFNLYDPESGKINNIGAVNATSPLWQTVVAGPTDSGFIVSYSPGPTYSSDEFSSQFFECNNDGSKCTKSTLPNVIINSVAPVKNGYQVSYCEGNPVDGGQCYVQASIDGKWLPRQDLSGPLLGLDSGNALLLGSGYPNENYILYPNASILAGPFSIPSEDPFFIWQQAYVNSAGQMLATFCEGDGLGQGVATITIDSSGNAKPAEITMPFKPPRTLEKVNPATIPTTLFNNTARVIAGAAASASIAAINSTSAESASAQNPSAGNYELPSNSLLFLMAACGSLIVFLSVYAAYRLTRSAPSAGNICNDAEQQSLQEQQGLVESRRLSK